MTNDQIWQLYLDGETSKAEDAIAVELSRCDEEAQKQGLYAILAWCAYRNEKYAEAVQHITTAGNNQRAKECHAYIVVYAPGYINDQKLVELVKELGDDNVYAINALVVRARAEDSVVADHGRVWLLAEKFARQANVALHDVALANLLNNCGRFFQEKARDVCDLFFALGLMKAALPHYGETTNWHHRAGICFWMSHLHERLGAIPDAFALSVASFGLWIQQCIKEKKNAAFLKKMATAQARVAKLSEVYLNFAFRAQA